jgi:hypothetical protein
MDVAVVAYSEVGGPRLTPMIDLESYYVAFRRVEYTRVIR